MWLLSSRILLTICCLIYISFLSTWIISSVTIIWSVQCLTSIKQLSRISWRIAKLCWSLLIEMRISERILLWNAICWLLNALLFLILLMLWFLTTTARLILVALNQFSVTKTSSSISLTLQSFDMITILLSLIINLKISKQLFIIILQNILQIIIRSFLLSWSLMSSWKLHLIV